MINSTSIKNDISGNDILSDMPNILNWFEVLGLKSLNIRYTRYLNHIKDFYNLELKEVDSSIGREKFNILTKALMECFHISIIYRTFKHESSKGFKTRLSKVITGPDYLDKNPNNTESRNYLYELLIAGRFKTIGYEIQFNHLTDVVAVKNDLVIYVECKKLESLKMFEKNFKKAGKQLDRELKNIKGNVHGLIFIDISSVISENLPNVEVDNNIIALEYLKKAMKIFNDKYQREINSLNDRFIDTSLAVVLMGSTMIWTKDIKPYLVSDIQAITAEDLKDEKFNLLKSILKDFDKSFMSLF